MYAEDDVVVIGNSLIERRFTHASGLPAVVSILDKRSGFEWTAPQAGAMRAETPPDLQIDYSAAPGSRACVSAPSYVAEVKIPSASGLFRHEIEIFPGFPGVVQRIAGSDQAAGEQDAGAAPATGVERDPGIDPSHFDACGDSFELSTSNVRLKALQFTDQTDSHNELVQEARYLLHKSESQLRLAGNLFAFELTLGSAGLAFLHLAPLPNARPDKAPYDLAVAAGRRLHVRSTPSSVPLNFGYRWASLLYDGSDAGLTAVLQNFQRLLRMPDPARDGLFITNTWGDRGKDGRVCESFIREELAVASQIGADVVQIDDGWQAGASSNSVVSGGVWEGFQKKRSFWQAHPQRFPQGLAPLARDAREKGLAMGLWFAPDSSNDFENWKGDVDTILGIHRDLNIDHFKLDSIKLRSALGEHRLHRFLNEIRETSGGKIVCDLDVTAESRPGYFGSPESGPLFVENRYTDWGNYYPHATLRNLWKLSRYVDPVRLRFEFLNNERNPQAYGDDPLAPAKYDPAYLFASCMVASPLGWFEMTSLSVAYRERLAAIVGVWRKHRRRLHAGVIHPVGSAPDGSAWTGFYSQTAEGAGDLIAFRELNDQPTGIFSLPGVGYRSRVKTLFGDGAVEPFDGGARAYLDRPLSFVWASLETG